MHYFQNELYILIYTAVLNNVQIFFFIMRITSIIYYLITNISKLLLSQKKIKTNSLRKLYLILIRSTPLSDNVKIKEDFYLSLH